MKRQFLELFTKNVASVVGTDSIIVIIFNCRRCFNEVVDRSVEEKCIGIDVVQGTEIQYGSVGYGVSSFHRGKGRGYDAKSCRNILVMNLGATGLYKYGLEFCNNGLKVVHSAMIGKYMRTS